MEQQSNSQRPLILIIVAIVAVLICVGCGMIAVAGGLASLFIVPYSSQSAPSSTDPTNPDRALYLEIADEQLHTLEGGSDRIRELLTQSGEGTITAGSAEWNETALIAENWISNGHDIMIGVNPPPELTDLHALVMEAATICYILTDEVYNAIPAQLENLDQHTTACADAINTAQDSLATYYP